MLTKEQWVQLHRLCLGTLRSAIRGLPIDKMQAQPVPDDDSIGEQVSHVIGCEMYWLREVGINPEFQRLDPQAWTESNFVNVFEKIEQQYRAILDAGGLDGDILFGLGRVRLHARYHDARIATLRHALEPG